MTRRHRSILGVALLTAAFGSFFASKNPDTLESFLQRVGITEVVEPPEGEPEGAPREDRSKSGAPWLGAVAGVLTTFGLLTLLTSIVRRAEKGEPGSPGRGAP